MEFKKLNTFFMSIKTYVIILIAVLVMTNCAKKEDLALMVYETSAQGNKMQLVEALPKATSENLVRILPEKKFQTITGFGGSFTEASASLLNRLGKENRAKVLEAYFGESGARYSLTRTHMNSCDFSLSNYSYAPVEGDVDLEHFSVQEDMDDIIPMIKEAQEISKEGFKIIASPWTAPKWMKDNNDYRGGKLLPKYNDTWALFFSKYLKAYTSKGIAIWGITVENEPLGNDNNWDSMHFTAEEMTSFVQNHLGPKLEANGHDVKILGYDQNRDHLKDWVDVMYENASTSKYYAGTAIHWYASTYDVFSEELQYAHKKAPKKYLIQTEACVDSEIPKWKDDAWYWKKEATDWGWDWAPDKDKYLHPKYAPVNRYARDIIGCMNNWVDGWVDWNMVLDKQGGPNWFKNWCVAPIIVDPESDEVYFTPIYYTMSHFSKFVRPGAVRIGIETSDKELLSTAFSNPDGSIAVVLFNEKEDKKTFTISLGEKAVTVAISGKAIQTVLLNSTK